MRSEMRLVLMLIESMSPETDIALDPKIIVSGNGRILNGKLTTMTKDDKKDNSELEKKLEEIQKEKAQNDENDAKDKKDENVGKDEKIQQLEKALQEQMEITKRAQHDYINLKWDFDRYMQNMKEKSASLEVDTLISVVKKFLPFVENLRKSLASIVNDQKDSPFVK